MAICLLPEELVELTQKKQSAAQARVLEYMGIPYRRRPDGTVVVLWVHLRMGPEPDPVKRRPQLRP